jgi:hypothetical protein
MSLQIGRSSSSTSRKTEKSSIASKSVRIIASEFVGLLLTYSMPFWMELGS